MTGARCVCCRGRLPKYRRRQPHRQIPIAVCDSCRRVIRRWAREKPPFELDDV